MMKNICVFWIILILAQVAYALPDQLLSCEADYEKSLELAKSEGKEVSRVSFDTKHKHLVIFSGIVTPYFLNVLDHLPPEITTIGLQLPRGGHAVASLLIAEKIRSLGLNTYVGITRCHSACTIIFQGGVERIVDDGALLSYHGPGRKDGKSSSCTNSLITYGQQQMVSWGFAKSELDVLVNHATLNFFNSTELLKLGIATDLKSLDIGNEGVIRKAREAARKYCEDYPEDDEC